LVKTFRGQPTNRPPLKGLSLIAQINFQRTAAPFSAKKSHSVPIPNPPRSHSHSGDKKTQLPDHRFSLSVIRFESRGATF
jgi:hypothetical protein